MEASTFLAGNFIQWRYSEYSLLRWRGTSDIKETIFDVKNSIELD